MDNFAGIMIKLQQILALLDIVEVKATNENLKCMLIIRNTIESIKSELSEPSDKASIKEDESNAR